MAIRYGIIKDRAIKKYLNSIGFEYMSPLEKVGFPSTINIMLV